MNRRFVERISKIERVTREPRWRVVVKDDGVYSGECGNGLSQEQFEGWVKMQDKDTQVIVVEVALGTDANSSEGGEVAFKVENHADKNLCDLLREYDSAFGEAGSLQLPRANLGEYSEKERDSILEAYRIIREHNPVVRVESMH